RFWMEGVLQEATADGMLEPSRSLVGAAIDHPWAPILGSTVLPDPEAVKTYSMAELFHAADRAMLLLGPPGSGKTIAMLQLGQDLLEQAARDPDRAIPVVLHLASWAEQRPPLDEWVVEELTSKYQIPRRFGRPWLHEDQLILLLDGFDEVQSRFRADCASAINAFRQQCGLTGLMVCSRTQPYFNSATPLRMGAAVALEELADEQIAAYLAINARDPVGWQQLLAADPALTEIARTPLGLKLLATTLEPVGSGPQASSVPTSKPLLQLFERYVGRMLGRRQKADYEQDQMLRWLGWLARRLTQHNQAMLLLEEIQPSWLPSRRWRWLYLALIGSIIGLFGGLMMWLLLQLARQTSPLLPVFLSARVSRLLAVEQGRAELLTLVLLNMPLGVLVSAVQGLFYEQQQVGPRPGTRRRWRVALSGLMAGLLSLAVVGLADPSAFALAWGVVGAVMYGTVARSLYGYSFRSDIRTMEALAWSWSGAAKGLAIGLALSAVAEALDTVLFGFDGVYRSVITFGLGATLLGGLRGRRVSGHVRPNEGIWLSLRNGALAALVVAPAMGVTTWILRTPTYAFYVFLLMFILTFTLFGGGNVVKHFLLRALLHWQGLLPWRLTHFLDRVAELALVRKVGGGYIFVHQLLQEYLAQLPIQPSAADPGAK
ncbi:MAG: NACHT domain-containing protein, partial [Candidatus Promineifilaceae bacterium]|nr:NACHT domain-containing protein [Candidatus Promineifilaceae bacterium]